MVTGRGCGEFQWERQKLLGRIGDIEGSGVWLEEFDGGDNIGKMVLTLAGRVVYVGLDRTVMERMDAV